MSETKKFGEVKTSNFGKYPDSKRVDEVLNKPIVISKVEIETSKQAGKNGEPLKVLYLVTDKGTFRTSASILLRDAEQFILPAIESGDKIQTVIRKTTFKSGYRGYVFGDVEE